MSQKVLFVLCFLSVVFYSSGDRSGRVKKDQCLDDIMTMISIHDNLDRLSVCAEKHQFHCIESDGLLCKIFNRNFECDGKAFCPKPLLAVEELIDNLRSSSHNFNKVVIEAETQNGKNGSLNFSPKTDFFVNLNQRYTRSLTLTNLNMTRMPPFYKKQEFKNIAVSGNNIEQLESHSFFDLPSLVSLDLQYNKIQRLAERSFEKLDILEELNLSNNLLRVLNKNAFVDLRNLKTLSVSNNQLHFIHTDVPRQTASLINLDLSSNEFEEMPDLQEHQNLEFLALNQNRIKKFFCDDRIQSLKKLEIIELNDNNISEFSCDLNRHLPALYSVLLNRNQLTSLSQASFFEYLKLNKGLTIKGKFLFFIVML